MNDTRRKVEDRADAVGLLGQLEASGLGIPEFCSERGIDGRSLQCWRTNLRKSEGVRPRPEVRLVELTAPSSRPALPAGPALYRVVVGEFAVEVDDAFREDTLRRLLGVVGRC